MQVLSEVVTAGAAVFSTWPPLVPDSAPKMSDARRSASHPEACPHVLLLQSTATSQRGRFQNASPAPRKKKTPGSAGVWTAALLFSAAGSSTATGSKWRKMEERKKLNMKNAQTVISTALVSSLAYYVCVHLIFRNRGGRQLFFFLHLGSLVTLEAF